MALDLVSPATQSAWLRLALVPGVSVRHQVALLHAFRSAEQVFTMPTAEVAAVVGDDAASRLAHGPPSRALDQALAWLQSPGHHLVTWGDACYPKLLLEIANPPCVLYARGRIELLDKPALAIVGSRNATAQGARDAETFAEALSGAGLTIVSGLALGIDAAAHRGGLRGPGSSIAVVGTGADRVYPLRNKGLADDLAARGLIVSEFPLGTPALRENFPRRSRLISGLSRGVLVVEAAPQSGSLITARFASEQGREVFAIPGSIHSPLSRGCHRLIRQGAKLVESADDIFTELGALLAGLGEEAARSEEPDGQAETGRALDKEYEILLDALGFEPASVDALVSRTGLRADAVASMLLILELEGQVEQQHGGVFCRKLPGEQE